MHDHIGRDVRVAPKAAQPARPRPRRDVFGEPGDVLAVIACGGAIGALARYGIGLAWPTPARGFPEATLFINLLGCALMGVLMVLITEVWAGHRLVRPFLGTGVLGGFTTFSTYAVETERLVTAGSAATGLLYLVATPLMALAAVWTAVIFTRQAIRRPTHETDRQGPTHHRAYRR